MINFCTAALSMPLQPRLDALSYQPKQPDLSVAEGLMLSV